MCLKVLYQDLQLMCGKNQSIREFHHFIELLRIFEDLANNYGNVHSLLYNTHLLIPTVFVIIGVFIDTVDVIISRRVIWN